MKNTIYNLASLKSLLAETLCEKSTSYVIEEIFSRFPSIAELLDVTEQELISIKGIGRVKARQITSALKLVRFTAIPNDQPTVIRSPQDVWQLLAQELSHLHKEHFICLLLNTKNHVLVKETISIGSLSAAVVHPREVFRPAIKRAAASIVCAHNHPSGDPTPSNEDIQLTARLVESGKIIGIEVLDHMVFGNDRFYSLKEHGHI